MAASLQQDLQIQSQTNLALAAHLTAGAYGAAKSTAQEVALQWEPLH